MIRSRTLRTHNRAAQALRMAAESAGRGRSAMGAYYRRMKGRLGARQAITATAHKLARIVYYMLRDHEAYKALSAKTYTAQQSQRELKALQKRAAKLGYVLQTKPAGGTVSE